METKSKDVTEQMDLEQTVRNELRRTLMLISHQQPGGRNFQAHEATEGTIKPNEKNASPASEQAAMADSTCGFFKDKARYSPGGNPIRVKERKSGNVIFSPYSPQRYINTATKPPGQRIDDGDNEVQSSPNTYVPPFSPSKHVSPMKTLAAYMQSQGKGSGPMDIDIPGLDGAIGPDEISFKRNFDSTNASCYPRQEIFIEPERIKHSRGNSGMQQSNPFTNERDSRFEKREYTIIPEPRKTKGCEKNTQPKLDSERQTNEISILPVEAQIKGPVLKTIMVETHHKNRPPLNTYYGRKANGRSLISMNSFNSSANSILSGNSMVNRTESMGLDSFMSGGSTALELECLFSTSLVRGTTASSLGAVFEGTATDTIRNNSSVANDIRPSNPMSLSLLNHQKSMTTVDTNTSRMSMVSTQHSTMTASTTSTPPPVLIQPTSFLQLGPKRTDENKRISTNQDQYEMFQPASTCTERDRSTELVSKMIESLQDLRYCDTTQNQDNTSSGTPKNIDIEFLHNPNETNSLTPAVISANSTAVSGFGDDNLTNIRSPSSTAFTPYDRSPGKTRTRTEL